MSYYNTTEIKGNDLEHSIKQARSQDDKIYSLFLKSSNLSAWDVLELYKKQFGMILIGSVRRSLNTLAANGSIEVGDKVMGPYGKPEYQYHLHKPIEEEKKLPIQTSLF